MYWHCLMPSKDGLKLTPAILTQKRSGECFAESHYQIMSCFSVKI